MYIKITSNRDVLKKVTVVLVGIFIICTIGFFINIIKYSKYIEVKAKIVDVKLIYDNNGYDNQNRNRYLQYKYTFNGVDYDAEQLVFWKSRKCIGKEVILKVNPQNPQEIANYTSIKSFIIIDVMSIILLVLIKKMGG